MRVFFPRRCPVCEKVLPDNPLGYMAYVCLECNSKLHYITAPRCMKCGKQIISMEQEYCSDCSEKEHFFKQGVGLFGYDNNIKKSLYRFKYSNQRDYAKFYGAGIAARYGYLIRQWKPEVIIPVPMYQIKVYKRGYNQAALLAKELGEALKIPVDYKLLVRVKNTKPMKELNDKERVKNLQNAFKLSENIVKYKKILLVDDIYTTGTTIDHCSELLLKSGATEIYYACVCIGNGY